MLPICFCLFFFPGGKKKKGKLNAIKANISIKFCTAEKDPTDFKTGP